MFSRKTHQQAIHRYFHHNNVSREAGSTSGYGWFLITVTLVAVFIVLSNLGVAS